MKLFLSYKLQRVGEEDFTVCVNAGGFSFIFYNLLHNEMIYKSPTAFKITLIKTKESDLHFDLKHKAYLSL